MLGKLTYGVKDGVFAHINDVQKGLSCGCTCPACGSQLIARKGEKTAHHFAHYKSVDCKRGHVASLLISAAKMLSKVKRLSIPQLLLPPTNIIIAKEQDITLTNVRLERRLREGILDLVACSGSKELLIIFKMDKDANDVNLENLKQKGFSVIEIDLSLSPSLPTTEDLANILFKTSNAKKWLYNNKLEEIKTLMKCHCGINLFPNKGTYCAPKCPRSLRNYKGMLFAKVSDDCMQCRYLLDYNLDMRYIVCGARNQQLKTLLEHIKKPVVNRVV